MFTMKRRRLYTGNKYRYEKKNFIKGTNYRETTVCLKSGRGTTHYNKKNDLENWSRNAKKYIFLYKFLRHI